MKLEVDSQKPIFLQIAMQIEDAIFMGIYFEEMQIPSTNEVAHTFKINPATVLKGMNILVSENIIYKKRGIGMFVKQGALKKVKSKRQNEFYDKFFGAMIEEAQKLEIKKEELVDMILRRYSDERN